MKQNKCKKGTYYVCHARYRHYDECAFYKEEDPQFTFKGDCKYRYYDDIDCCDNEQAIAKAEGRNENETIK